MNITITESQYNRIFEDKTITCKCGWEWKLSDGGDDPYTCHKCGHVNKEQDIDERSRSFAFTRKKRKFSKPERMSNPLRYKEIDRLDEQPLTDDQIKSIEQINKDSKFLKCKNCKKKFTQTTHKGKKSLPVCPWCGTHNNEHR